MLTCPYHGTKVQDAQYDECSIDGNDILTAYCPDCNKRVEPDSCNLITGSVLAICLIAAIASFITWVVTLIIC